MNSKLRHFCITATCIWPNWILIKHAYNLHKVFLFPVGQESRLCSVAVFSVRYGAYPLRDGSLFMQREGGGGRGGKQDGEGSRLFQITKSGGLNSFIKKFRGGSAVWSQVTFSKFPNIHSSLCSSHIFDLCHWTVHHNFLQLMTILWLFAHSSVWSNISEGLERKVRYLPKRALLSSDNMYFSFLSTLSVLFFIPHLFPRSMIK